MRWSVACVRVVATSNANPVHASHAEKVRRVIGRIAVVVIWVFCISAAVDINKATNIDSIQSKAETRWVRCRANPNKLRMKVVIRVS